MAGLSDISSRREFIKTATASGAALTLAGCTGESTGSSSSETITIGLLQPFTGEVGWVGESSEVAVEIAIDEINNAGGINGTTVEIVAEDTEAGQQTATSAIRAIARPPRESEEAVLNMYSPPTSSNSLVPAVGEIIGT